MYLVPGPPYSPLFPAHFLLTGCLKEKIRFCMKDIVSPINLLNMKTTLEILRKFKANIHCTIIWVMGLFYRLILGHLLVIVAFHSFWETLYYCTLKIATYMCTHWNETSETIVRNLFDLLSSISAQLPFNCKLSFSISWPLYL